MMLTRSSSESNMYRRSTPARGEADSTSLAGQMVSEVMQDAKDFVSISLHVACSMSPGLFAGERSGQSWGKGGGTGTEGGYV